MLQYCRSRRGWVSKNRIAVSTPARLFFLTVLAISIAPRPFKFREISVSISTRSFVFSIHSFAYTVLVLHWSVGFERFLQQLAPGYCWLAAENIRGRYRMVYVVFCTSHFKGWQFYAETLLDCGAHRVCLHPNNRFAATLTHFPLPSNVSQLILTAPFLSFW